jgi:hypothetical protein
MSECYHPHHYNHTPPELIRCEHADDACIEEWGSGLILAHNPLQYARRQIIDGGPFPSWERAQRWLRELVEVSP